MRSEQRAMQHLRRFRADDRSAHNLRQDKRGLTYDGREMVVMKRSAAVTRNAAIRVQRGMAIPGTEARGEVYFRRGPQKFGKVEADVGDK